MYIIKIATENIEKLRIERSLRINKNYNAIVLIGLSKYKTKYIYFLLACVYKMVFK